MSEQEQNPIQEEAVHVEQESVQEFENDLDTLIQAVEEVKEETVATESEPTEKEVIYSKATVQQKYDVMGHPDGGTPDIIQLPPENRDVIDQRISDTPNTTFGETSKEKIWSYALNSSLDYQPLGNMYKKRLEREGSSFTQEVNYKGTPIRGLLSTSRAKEGMVEMEGEGALLRLVTHLGIGGLAQAPLFNSGFWVYFKPPREIDILELNNIIAADKVRLGRDSYGLAHTNHIAYTLSRVFDFALRHVYNTSIDQKEVKIGDLGKWIVPQDINTFLWGFLLSMYPSGFHFERPCINEPTKCTHVEKGNISLLKLLAIDEAALTDWQKNHMRSFATGSMKLADVQRYQSEVTSMHSKRVVLNEGTSHAIAFTLKTPKLFDYFNQSFKYIDGLVDHITRSLDTNVSLDQRNVAIEEASNATALCQWIHFFESVEYGDLTPGNERGYIVKDPDTITNVLSTLSSTDSVREAVVEEVMNYVENSTNAIIGIPAFDCPVCGKPQDDDPATKNRYPRFSAWIPLDVLQVFFGLIGQRLNRISQR